MNKSILLVIFLLILVITSGYLLSNPQNQTSQLVNTTENSPIPQITKGNCLADDCLLGDTEYPVSELPVDIKDALNKALTDEYKAYATYNAVTKSLGNIRPFIMIQRAEQQHINALLSLFEKYSLPIPENNYLSKVTAPNELKTACAIGVQAEIDNIKLYKESLLPLVKNYPDITIVFRNLMNASEQKHLPAFQRCD